MKTKKVLIEGMSSISWIEEELLDSETFNEAIKHISDIAWNVIVSHEIDHSKNLTDEEKKELNPLLSRQSDAVEDLRHNISENKLDELEAAFDAIHEFCTENDIQIINEFEDEDWDDENDDESDDESDDDETDDEE
ncbi:hypothetical protein S231_03400 [Candidatus Phytoplasma solani]|nr:hypothetical protein S231_03400 [Candidatus Phytoplasma solani]